MGAWIAWPFALFAGALITAQAGANAALKRSFGEPMPALVVNYLLGLAVAGWIVVTRVSWPPMERMAQAPWWAWIGGLAGAVYGIAAILLGAATLMALVVTGQLVCSVLVDHYGWIGFEPHLAGWGRILGCVLMIAGFTLVAKF
jgi:bacterial/archaeal transporter family-2 protein